MTPLHHLGEFLRQLLLGVPLEAARGLFLCTFLVLLAWVLTLSRHETTDPSPGGRAHDLKPWAALALLIQLTIYVLL